MRLKVELTIDERDFADEVSQFVWKACGKLRSLSDSSGPLINKMIKDEKDYEQALYEISQLRERLYSIDTTLADITSMMEGYLDYLHPKQEQEQQLDPEI